MLQQFAKKPMHLNLDLYDSIANKFEKLPLYFLTFHGPQPLNMVMDVSYLFQFINLCLGLFISLNKCIKFVFFKLIKQSIRLVNIIFKNLISTKKTKNPFE